MGVLAFFRVPMAVVFWRKARLAAFVYVGCILFFALIQLVFHVSL
jgi:hypothetical protein